MPEKKLKKSRKTWTALKQKHFTPEKIQAIEEQAEQELAEEAVLRKLREELHLTQEQVAELGNIDQGQLSRAERSSDWRVSVLKRIAKGLGAELKVALTVGGREIDLLSRD
jgi:hypothetical protein